MKPLVVTIAVSLIAVKVVAQGTVRFENNIPGVLVTHVYGVNPDFMFPGFGNGPSDTPPGDMYWKGWPLVAGTGFSAQLLAAPGADMPLGSLRPASPITTFQTGANAGFIVPMTATLQGVPADAPVATVIMVAWDNQNGTVNTWDDAHYNAITRWGAAPAINVFNIGGSINPPPIMTGLQSFGMGEFMVPEPSSFALLGFGTTVLLFWMRKRRS